MSTATPRLRDAVRALFSRDGGGRDERSLETLALGAGTVAFVAAALVALLAFGLDPAPIAGDGSIGQFAAVAAGIVAVLAFVGGRIVVGVRAGVGRVRLHVLDVVDVLALAFAHAVIAVLTWTLLAVIMERSFIDAEVFTVPLLLLAGTVAAMTAYVVFFSATHMDLQLLAVVLAVFLAEGVMASMLTANDPHWWKDNLSALGMTTETSSLTFNLTLIVAGIVVTTLARYATRGIPTADPRGTRWVRLALVLVGVLLGLVGVFPVDRFFLLHTGFASGMAVVFGVLVIMIHWLVPGLSRAFIGLGWIFVAVIAGLAILFAAGVYTLTAVELVAGILVFAWIVLFIRNAAALQQDVDPEAVRDAAGMPGLAV